MLFETATLRSGYQLTDTKAYGDRIERMLRLSMSVDLNEQVCPLRLEWMFKALAGDVYLKRCLISFPVHVQVEEEPEEEPEEPAEDAEAEDKDEVQADDDGEESVSVPFSLLV